MDQKTSTSLPAAGPLAPRRRWGTPRIVPVLVRETLVSTAVDPDGDTTS